MLQPGLDVKPLLAELRARITEELDYELEAEAQRGFAEAYKDDDEIFIPDVSSRASSGSSSPSGSTARRCRRSSRPARAESATAPGT